MLLQLIAYAPDGWTPGDCEQCPFCIDKTPGMPYSSESCTMDREPGECPARRIGSQ